MVLTNPLAPALSPCKPRTDCIGQHHRACQRTSMSFLWVASLATTSSLSGGRREPASSASSLITSTVVSVTLPTIPKHRDTGGGAGERARNVCIWELGGRAVTE